jgi:ABC-type phosphate transport system substrate-binding protein
MRHLILLASGSLLSFAAVRSSAQTGSTISPSSAASFVVVVHSDNPVTTVSRAELAEMFLKRLVKWPKGARIAPVDLPSRSSIRGDFSKSVHTRSAEAVSAYWRQQIFSGKDTPPPEKKNDADVLTFVRENPGAIGYVASGTSLGTGVKTVTVRGP